MGGVTPANEIGVWATDVTGALHLVRRLGDTLTIRGKSGIVTKIDLLGKVSGSPGARHSHNDAGDIVRRITIEGPLGLARTRYRVVSLDK